MMRRDVVDYPFRVRGMTGVLAVALPVLIDGSIRAADSPPLPPFDWRLDVLAAANARV